MNRIYRLVWSGRRNAFVVASELAKAKRKQGSVCSRMLLLCALALPSCPTYSANISATALPSGGRVVAGQAAISQSGAKMDISQSTDRAILNWEGYDIGTDAHVNYNQPSSSSISLNRVSGDDASHILGHLSANGRVFLANPNGIVFGKDAQVDVSGLLATTSDISNDDFMRGDYKFVAGASTDSAAVENQGRISVAERGFAALVAPVVSNSGVIQAHLGEVVLGSAKHYALDFYGDRLVQFDVTERVASGGLHNSGRITADGGRVLISAEGVERVVNDAVNMDGIIEARTVAMEDGEIVLSGADKGAVIVSGELDASGKGSGERGGSIEIVGEKVGLAEGARVDVSGDSGGGKVTVGVRRDGGGRKATITSVSDKARINADAVGKGDGGSVIVWADDTTKFHGTISARGGSKGGDGGLVETSGKQVLELSGKVDASADHGKGGSWLLDPRNVTISTSSAGVTLSEGSPDLFSPSADDATVDVGAIKSSLDGGTSVVINTGSDGELQEGNIVFDAPLTVAGDAESNVALTLTADGSVTFHNGGIVDLAGNRILSLNISAGNNGGTGSVDIGRKVSIEGDLNVTALSGGISQSAALTVGGASSFFAGAGDAAISLNDPGNSLKGAVTLSSTGNASIDNGITALRVQGVVGGDLSLNASAAISDSDTLIVHGTTMATTDVDDQPIELNQLASTGNVIVTTQGTMGHVTIDNTDTALNVQGTVSGNLSLNASATISDSDTLVVRGTTTVTTDVDDQPIELNQLASTGNVIVTTQGTRGDVTIDNGTTALNVQGTVRGNLNLNAGAAIRDSDTLVVSGTTTATTDMPNRSITLDQLASTGKVTVATQGTKGHVTIDNTDTALDVQGTVGGNLILTAGEAITDSDALVVSGTTTVTTDVADKPITLEQLASIGDVIVSTETGGDATIDNGTTALNVQGKVGGNLSLTAGEAITSSGELEVGGTTTAITDVDNKPIKLDQLTSKGSVTVTTHGRAGHVTIDNRNTALSVQGAVGGDLSLTASKAITDAGELTVGGATTVATNGDNRPIELDQLASTGNVTVTTQGTKGHVTIDNGATALGVQGTVGGKLSLNASAAISDSDTLVVHRTTTVTTGDQPIELDQLASTGNVIVTTQGTMGDVSIDNGTTALHVQGTVGGNLSLAAGEAIDDSGALTVSGTTKATTYVDDKDITLNQLASTGEVIVGTQGEQGDVTIDNGANALHVQGMVSGNLTLKAENSIDSSGNLSVGSATKVTTYAQDKSITLDQLASIGDVIVSTKGTEGHVTIDNGTTALNVQGMAGGNLSLTAGEAITDSGVLVVSGTTTATTDVPNRPITLDQLASTGTVTVATQGTKGHVTIDNTDTALNVQGTVGGNLILTAGEAITDSDALAVSGTTTVTTDVADKPITLNQLASIGEVIVSTQGTGGDVTIGSSATALGVRGAVGGDLNLTAGRAITDSGELTVGGTTSVTTNVDNQSITLDQLASIGEVIVSTQGTKGHVTIDNTDTALGVEGSVRGNLTLTAGGTITDSGALEVDGTTTVTTDVADKPIILDQLASIGEVIVSTQGTEGHVTIDNGDTALGVQGTVGGNLRLTAGEAITDSDVLKVGGTTTVETDVADKPITLDQLASIGEVIVSTQGTDGDVTIDNGDTALGVQGMVGGDLSLTAGQAITDSGVLVVSGTTTATTDVRNRSITLDQLASTGKVTVATQGTKGHVIIDNTDTALGVQGSVGGDLSLRAGEGITDSGELKVGGTTTVTTDVADKPIELNQLTSIGDVIVSTQGAGGDVTIDNGTTALNVRGTVHGDLSLTAGEAITDSGVLVVSGTTTATTDVRNRSITLDQLASTGKVTVATQGTKGHVTIDNTDTALGVQGTVGGNLILTAGEAITDSDALAVSGTTTVTTDAADKPIELNQLASIGEVIVSTQGTGGDVTIGSSATALGVRGTVGGDLSLIAGRAITDSGELTVGGTTSVTTNVDNQSITLDQLASTGKVTVSTQGTKGHVTIDNTDTALGVQGSVRGNLILTAGKEITDSGALKVDGTTTVTTDVADTPIELNQLASIGEVIVSTQGTGGHVTIDNGNTALGVQGTVGGNLRLTAGEAITDSDVLTVGGTTKVKTDVADKPIILDQLASIGEVIVSTKGTGGDVTIDNGDTALGVQGTVGGDLSLTAGEAITSSGELKVGGTTTATTDVEDKPIELGQLASKGSVTVTTQGRAGHVTIDNTDTALNVQGTVGGDLSLRAGEAITDSGELKVGGTTTVTTDVDNQSITLDQLASEGKVTVTTQGTKGHVTIDNTNTALHVQGSVGGNLSLTAGEAIDDSGALTVSGTTKVTTYVYNKDITLNQLASTRKVIVGTQGTQGDVTINNGANALHVRGVVGGNLILKAGEDIDSGGDLVVGGTTEVTAAKNKSITLGQLASEGEVIVSTKGTEGHVIIDNGTTALNVQGKVGGDLSLTAGEAITSSGELEVKGNTTAITDVDNKPIKLDQLASKGSVTVTTHGRAGHVTIDNTDTALSVQGTVGGDLSLTAGEAITDAGELMVGGTTTVTTDVDDKRITLTHLASTGNVIVTTQGAEGHVTIDNTDTALGVQGTVYGNLILTAGEAITNSGTLAVSGTTTAITDVADKRITLDQLASEGTVTVTTQGTEGHVTIDNTDTALHVQGSVGGNLSLTADEAIDNSGALTVSGTTKATTYADDITLDRLASTGEVIVGTQGNVTIDNDAKALRVQGSVGGDLSLRADKAITDSGELTVGGTTTVTTEDVDNEPIELDQLASIGEVIVSTEGTRGHVTIDNGTTALGVRGTVGGDLSLTAGEAITDSGALVVSGTTTATTDVPNKPITLDQLASIGEVIVSTQGTRGHVTIDNGDTALGVQGTVGGDLSLTVENAILGVRGTVGGDLSMTADGAINVNDDLSVRGTTTVTINKKDRPITLNRLASSGNVSVTTYGTQGNVHIDSGTAALHVWGTVGGELYLKASELEIVGDINAEGAVNIVGDNVTVGDINAEDAINIKAKGSVNIVSDNVTLGGDIYSRGYDVSLPGNNTLLSGNRTINTCETGAKCNDGAGYKYGSIFINNITDGDADANLYLLAGGKEAAIHGGGNIVANVDVYDLFLTGEGGELTGFIRSVSPDDGREAAERIATSPSPHGGTFTFNGYRVVGRAVEGESKRRITIQEPPKPQADPYKSLFRFGADDVEAYGPGRLELASAGFDLYGTAPDTDDGEGGAQAKGRRRDE